MLEQVRTVIQNLTNLCMLGWCAIGAFAATAEPAAVASFFKTVIQKLINVRCRGEC